MNKNQRIALAEKNLKIKDLGFKLNLHPTYVSAVLKGLYMSKKTRKNICNMLEKPESFLWPNEKG